MQHPEFLLIPALMLSDYALTIAGARARSRSYGDHFRTEHYELNPVWQKDVEKLRWLNPRHLLLTATITVFFGIFVESPGADQASVESLEGLMLGAFGTVNGRHLGNLMTFAWLEHHRDAIDGTVTMSHELMLGISTFQGFAFVVPSGLLALLSPTPIVIGFFAGALTLLGAHAIWMLRYRRKRQRAAAADPPPER